MPNIIISNVAYNLLELLSTSRMFEVSGKHPVTFLPDKTVSVWVSDPIKNRLDQVDPDPDLAIRKLLRIPSN